MNPELLMWLLFVVAIWLVIWFVTQNWQLGWLGILRAGLRSFAVSLAFAPTAISTGMLAIPCPASAVILSYPFDSNRGDRDLLANTHTAIFCFFVFWGICFAISLALFSMRRKLRDEKKKAC